MNTYDRIVWKKIIVTGAAMGIGKSIVLSCLEQGTIVYALDYDNQALSNLANEYSEYAEILHIKLIDVSVYDEVYRTMQEICMDQIIPYALINNAGLYFGKSILEYDIGHIDRLINVNIKGAIYCSQAFIKLRSNSSENAVIINMSSVSGQESSSDAIYGMSKSAIIGFTKSCALSFAPYVRVNAIAPGLVSTPMIDHVPDRKMRAYREHELIKEAIQSEDVAQTALFLLSDAAKHYTGAVFDLNNGCYMRA